MKDSARRRWQVVGAVAAVLVTVAVSYRVLAPAELLTVARTEYPVVAASPAPEVVGTLTAAPLIVDGRLRVYASSHQVRADRPIDTRTVRTPYWSYRRWPAQLHGVVVKGTTVVSRWSDGELVALDARTGRIAWRAAGPEPGQGYRGRRTGAATLYSPAGLYLGTTQDGQGLVVASGGAELAAFRLDSGRQRWRIAVDEACGAQGFTTMDGFLATNCRRARVEFRDLATGAVTAVWRPGQSGGPVEVEPVGCATGRSSCAAMRTTSGGDSRGWLLDGAEPVAAPPLDRANTLLLGDTAVQVAADTVVARPVRGTVASWRRTVPPDTRLLAVQPGRVHLLTPKRELITLDQATGVERSRVLLTYGRDSMDWASGLVDARYGFLVLERLARPVAVSADDLRYYVTIQPVILAGT